MGSDETAELIYSVRKKMITMTHMMLMKMMMLMMVEMMMTINDGKV